MAHDRNATTDESELVLYESELALSKKVDNDGYFMVQRGETIEQWGFHVTGDTLRYQGPLNSGHQSWKDVPDDVVVFAEQYADAELVGDTDEWREIRDGEVNDVQTEQNK